MPNILYTIYRIYIHIYSYSYIYISLGSFGRRPSSSTTSGMRLEGDWGLETLGFAFGLLGFRGLKENSVSDIFAAWAVEPARQHIGADQHTSEG